jgi:hypothetical protein
MVIYEMAETVPLWRNRLRADLGAGVRDFLLP